MTTAVAGALRADAFAPDAVYAYWDGSGDETASREIARGREPIRAVLARWAEAETLVSVSDGRDCFVEGRLGDSATFAAALQLDGSGAIARCLSFHAPIVEPAPAPASRSSHSARAILDRYFLSLTAGDFEAASRCFSEDCLYSHPPYSAGATLSGWPSRRAASSKIRRGFQRRSSSRSAITTPAVKAAALDPIPLPSGMSFWI